MQDVQKGKFLSFSVSFVHNLPILQCSGAWGTWWMGPFAIHQ